MFTVTRTLVFPQKRRIELAQMNGQQQADPPPVVVSIELECETEAEVDASAELGQDVVQAVGKYLQGRRKYAEIAHGALSDLWLLGLNVKSVTVTSGPGFMVKCELRKRPRTEKEEEEVRKALAQ